MSKLDRKTAYQVFHEIVGSIKEMFVGRADVIDTIALALLCKQHAFFVSPPGTAKTAIFRTFGDQFRLKFFGVQMRDDTKTEEILGMWDLDQLEKSRYCRKWARAADCEIMYMNECFKGSSNALNSALGLLHEREVDDENGYHAVPLWSAFLDSNELPRDPTQLAAFFDRILFKMPVEYLSEIDDQEKLLAGSDEPVDLSRIFMERQDLQTLHDCLGEIDVYDGYIQDVITIRSLLKLEGITVSDRTMAEACGLRDPRGAVRATPVRAHAFYNGRKEVEPKDLLVLENIFWVDPKQRPKIKKAVIHVTMPTLERAEELLDKLIDARSAALNPSGGKVDTSQIADAVSIALDTKRAIKMLADLDEDDMKRYLQKVSAIHAELSGRIMRV